MLAVRLEEFERPFLVVYRNIYDFDEATLVSQTEIPALHFSIKNKTTYHIQVQYEKKIKDQRKVEGWDSVSPLKSEGFWLEFDWCSQPRYEAHG